MGQTAQQQAGEEHTISAKESSFHSQRCHVIAPRDGDKSTWLTFAVTVSASDDHLQARQLRSGSVESGNFALDYLLQPGLFCLVL